MKSKITVMTSRKYGLTKKISTLLLMLVLLLAIATSPAMADGGPDAQWDKTFGGSSVDIAYSVQQTSDGGYILAGTTRSLGVNYYDAWLIKTDANGNQQWARTFGGSGDDNAYSVQQTSDGGYILAGYTNSYGAGSYDAWLIKTDANGNQQWAKTFGGSDDDYAISVQQTRDGGYILAGKTHSFSLGINYNAWLVKTDADGNQQWSKTFGNHAESKSASSVQQTSDGGYILAGKTKDSDADYVGVPWLTKIDADGNIQWTQNFLQICDNNDGNYSAQQTSDGGYILAGNISHSYGDAWLMKTDANGNQEWSRTYYEKNSAIADIYSVQQTSDGGYILAGDIALYDGGGGDAWLVKTDGNGNQQWSKIFGGNSTDSAYFVRQTSDGGYILAGATSSFGAGNYDAWLIKVNPEGTAVPGLKSISASPNNITFVAGKNQQLTITATYSDGTTQDVTNSATYQSSDTSVATVSNTGLVTAVAPGTANITVTYQNKTATVPVTVVEPSTIVQQGGDIIVLKDPEKLKPVTYNSAAGFTVTENGVDVPVTQVEVKDGTDGWPFSEIWLHLQHPVTVGSNVEVHYNPDPNCPIEPVDGGTVTVPTTTVVNQSSVPLTIDRSTVAVQPVGNVVYVTFPTKVNLVDYQGSAGFVIRYGNVSVPVTRVVTDGNGGYLYLEHPIPAGETVSVSYAPVPGQEITTVTGAPLQGTTNPVTIVNDSTSPVVIYDPPVVSQDGRTVTITAPSDMQDVIYEGNAGFRVFAGDKEIPVVKVEVKDNKIILYLGMPLIGGQMPSISYTPVDNQPIQTGNGTPVGSLDNLPGDNQSTLSVESITVEPAIVNVEEGKSQDLKVTVHYSDGSSADVTSLASFQSDNSDVAIVSGSQVTGVKAGTANVTVNYEGKTATVPVTVTAKAPVLTGIKATPNPVSIAKGNSQQLTVTAIYSDGSTQDVTQKANYQIVDASIASLTNNEVKGLEKGNTQVTVTYQGQSLQVPVTVTDAVVTKIEATPNPVSMPKGNSQQLTVIATYSDGSSKDVTGEASYQVADSSIASINGNSVKGLAEGNTSLIITYQGQTVTVPVTVTEAVVTRIEATPNPVSIAKGNSQQLIVTATYSDGSTRDVTQEASYQAENASIVAVEDSGLVKGLTQGNTSVTVTYQGQSLQVPVSVTAPNLVGLTVEPAQVSLEKGQSQKLTVIAKYSDGSTQDVSDEATFHAKDGSIASVTNGVVKGEAQGNTQVTVSYQGQSVQVPVTVTVPEVKLTGLTVEPSNVSVEAGKSQELKVTAHYSDGSSQEVTSQASYQSKDGQVAVVNAGVVTGVKQGNTQVTVSYQGQSAQVPVTVTAPPVTQMGISVVPNPIQVSRYGSMRLQVIAVMSDGSTKDVTIGAQFTSQNTSIATVKSNGVVYGKSNGETKITVTYDGQNYEIPVIVGQIPVISQDRPQPQPPVVIYPDKQQVGPPVVIYPQK